jgi:hypothetical protein
MHITIEKPIFIMGSGRSGTTIFYSLLSTHPDICWFSNYTDRFANNRIIPLLHRVVDFPFLGIKTKKNIMSPSGRKFSLKPVEAQRIYHEYCGFKHNTRMTSMDLRPEMEKKFKDIIYRHLILTKKKRFLTKQTANNQRIKLINKMFNDAYCVHIIRDGRAVAYSLLNVRWWNDTEIWWLGKKASEWQEKGREPIELCALHWKKDVEEIIKNKQLFKNRYIEINYEIFVNDVKGTMQRVIEFCKLNRSNNFLELLPKALTNMNYKWEKYLSGKEKDILNKTCQPLLGKLGYD